MGLLAGEKRKQKLGLDPNNLTWAKDTNSVGQSMLKKMGWKEGAGLGANEDGRVVPVKASMKSSSAGLGCTPQQADSWIAHGEEFDQILAALNASANGPDKPTSGSNSPKDEMEGQRRFYGRFSRGGVKQTRTAEDLNCIFGRRKNQTSSVAVSKQETDSSEDSEEQEDQTVDKSHGVETVKSTYSVQDYFAQKMQKLKEKKGEDSGCLPSNQSIEEDDCKTRDFNSYVTSECSVKDYFSRKMKAKTSRSSTGGECESLRDKVGCCGGDGVVSNGCVNLGEERSWEEVDDGTRKKKKKKRKTDEDVDSNQVVGDDVDDSGKLVEEKRERKKRKRRKHEDEDGDSTLDVENKIDDWCEGDGTEKKKREVVETSTNDLMLDTNEELDAGETTKKKKKKKKRNHGEVDENLNLDPNHMTVESFGEDKPVKSGKKKRKSKHRNENDDVRVCQGVEFDSTLGVTNEERKAKKKKRKTED